MITFVITGKGAVMPDIFGWTPLHYACVANGSRIFDFVLGAAIRNSKNRPVHKILDNYQRNPIHVAASCGNSHVLQTIISQLEKYDKAAVSLPDIDLMTPLHLATRAGDYRCVEQLIKASHGQSTSDLDIWGREALHIASSYVHSKIASLLLKHGSKPDSKDRMGKSPLDYLLKDGRGFGDLDDDEEHTKETKNRSKEKQSIFLELAKSARADFKDENGKTFLHYAVEFADKGTIKELLQRGLDIEAQDHEGQTPLHTAILARRAEIANGLINGSFHNTNRPADPAAKDRMGVTALMFASQFGLIEVAKLLLEKLTTAEVQVQDDDGAALRHTSPKTDALTARDSKGRSALHHALIVGEDDCAVFLLGQELPENPKDNDGDSLLVAACGSGCEKAVPRIIEKWPEIINDPDSTFGQTPLSIACRCKRGPIVDILLREKELDPNLQVKGGRIWYQWTALHVAVIAQAPHCITSLLNRADVSLDIENRDGQTPLALAFDNGRHTSAKAILVHKRTSDAVRIEHLTRFLARPASSFDGILADVLAQVNPASLTTDKMVEFVNASARFTNHTALEACFERVIERGAWKQIKLPCLLAARMGRADMVAALVDLGADPTEVDEDRWSCVDYAARFGYGQIAVDRMSKLVSEHPTPGAKPDYAMPTVFEIPEGLRVDIIADSLCDTEGHVGCEALSSQYYLFLQDGCSFR
jgi:ankyrin repeat protein